MLRVGWFSTGRGEGSQRLLRAVVDAISDGRVDAELTFVFSNREPGQFPVTDDFFAQVRSYGIPLATLSDARFRREAGGEIARKGARLPAWRRDYDRAVVGQLARYNCDIAMLAGYMLIGTEPLVEWRPLLNLHPAAPDGPEGTWQDVIWRLIDTRADHSGVRIHLGTPQLDAGPIVTYCVYGLQGPAMDPLWRAADGRTSAELSDGEGEALPLFQEIRRRGAARELPMVVETLREFADGRLTIVDRQPYAGGTKLAGGYDLTPEVERQVAEAGGERR